MGSLVWLKKGKASNNFQCMTICHRCVNPVAAQEPRDDIWIHLDLLIKNALISLPCTACCVPRLLEQARPPHHTAHGEINRPADAARKTRRRGRSCDHTKEALGPQKKGALWAELGNRSILYRFCDMRLDVILDFGNCCIVMWQKSCPFPV